MGHLNSEATVLTEALDYENSMMTEPNGAKESKETGKRENRKEGKSFLWRRVEERFLFAAAR